MVKGELSCAHENALNFDRVLLINLREESDKFARLTLYSSKFIFEICIEKLADKSANLIQFAGPVQVKNGLRIPHVLIDWQNLRNLRLVQQINLTKQIDEKIECRVFDPLAVCSNYWEFLRSSW